jgi:hypothetical protein
MGYDPVALWDLLDHAITTCVGYKKDPYEHCGNPISEGSIHDINLIRDAIGSGADIFYVQRQIPILATLCLCKRRHQEQAASVAEGWDREAKLMWSCRNLPSRTDKRVSTSVDQVFIEMDTMNAELDRHDQEMRDIAEQFRRDMAGHEETQSSIGQDGTF